MQRCTAKAGSYAWFRYGKQFRYCTLIIPYLNHACGQLDEQSTPVLRGAGKCSARTGEDTHREDLLAYSDVRKGGGNRQQQTRVAESFAAKGTALPDAAIDGCASVSRCTERTLWGIGLAANMTQGCHPMHRALNRRNPGITEEADPVAEWQFYN